MKKTVSLILHFHIPFISVDGGFEPFEDAVFDAIEKIFIPILQVAERRQAEKKGLGLAAVFTPSACAVLSSDSIRRRFEERLVARVRAKRRVGDKRALDDWRRWGGDIAAAFAKLQRDGDFEILATTATPFILPLFLDNPNVIFAQAAFGAKICRAAFGKSRGFWMPHQYYMQNIEKTLRELGFSYSIFDSSSFLLAEETPDDGIFSGLKFGNGFSVIPSVRENFFNDSDAEEESSFSSTDDFCAKIDEMLGKAAILLNGDVHATFLCEMSIFDERSAKIAGELDKFLSRMQGRLVVPSDVLPRCKDSKVRLAPSSNLSFDSENVFGSANIHLIRYVKKATEWMTDLVRRFPTCSAVNEKAFAVATREFVLLMSSDFPLLLKNGIASDYVENVFAETLKSFLYLYGVLGTDKPSVQWIFKKYAQHAAFPEMDYRLFAGRPAPSARSRVRVRTFPLRPE